LVLDEAEPEETGEGEGEEVMTVNDVFPARVRDSEEFLRRKGYKIVEIRTMLGAKDDVEIVGRRWCWKLSLQNGYWACYYLGFAGLRDLFGGWYYEVFTLHPGWSELSASVGLCAKEGVDLPVNAPRLVSSVDDKLMRKLYGMWLKVMRGAKWKTPIFKGKRAPHGKT